MQTAHAVHRRVLEQFLLDPRIERMNTCDPKRYSVHVAVLLKRGKVIASATNVNGSRSSGSGYSSRSIHAERNVVKQLGDVQALRGADMLVMRMAKSPTAREREEFLHSEPCPECKLFLEKCMREYGLKNVYYTA